MKIDQIKIKNLSKIYDNGFNALNNINLNIQYEGKKSFEKYDRYMVIGT